MILAAAPFQGTAVARLRHAVELRHQADAEEMRALAELAAEHSWTTTDEYDVIGGERAIRIGADGSRLVGEFLPLEVAATKGVSVTAATWLIRDVINLEARHPTLWRAILAGNVEPYKAFKLARLAASYELSHAQALEIDEQLAGKVGRLGWPRLLRLARGLIGKVATDKIEAAAKKAREARFVRNAPDQDHPIVTELWARLDTPDAQQLEATIQALAKKLRDNGDTDELDIRRAKALGILATPGRAQAILTGSDDQRYLPRTKVYLHLTPDMLTGEAPVARSETLGPLTPAMLADLFGTTRITITPVLHADTEQPVDSYESPTGSAKRSPCAMAAKCSPTPPAPPADSTSTTPSPTPQAPPAKPDPTTSDHSPAASTAPRQPAAGG